MFSAVIRRSWIA